MIRSTSVAKWAVAAVFLFFVNPLANASIVTLGDPDFSTGDSTDGWNSNMVIQESYSHTNIFATNETICVTNWSFDVGQDRGRVTPFLVTLNAAADDFDVVWTGATVLSDNVAGGIGLGDFGAADVGTTVTFSETGKFTLAPGETVAIGFLNSNPDGTGTSTPGSTVTYNGDTVPAGDMWYNGNSVADTYPNGVLTDVNLSGASAAGVTNRSYNFSIEFDASIAVPEPSSAGLILLVLGLAGLRRSR